MSKITLTPGEKRLQEKCLEQVRELDATERSLLASITRINQMQIEAEDEVCRGLLELDEIETSRLDVMLEGLSRLHMAEDFLAKRVAEGGVSLTEQTDGIEMDSVIAALIGGIDRPVNTSAFDRDRHLEGDENGVTSASRGVLMSSEFVEHNTRTTRAIEALDFFRIITSRAIQALQEIAEIERTHAKNMQKAFEQHGFPRTAPIASPGMRRLSMQMNSSAGSQCAELLSATESPSTRLGWYKNVFKFNLQKCQQILNYFLFSIFILCIYLVLFLLLNRMGKYDSYTHFVSRDEQQARRALRIKRFKS